MTYFVRRGESAFLPTDHVRGAWREDEQHVAPALGLLTHLVEADHARRRTTDRLAVSRLSFDILGTLPVEEVTATVEVRRAGRTIELVEAVLSHEGRPAVSLRAWLLQRTGTAAPLEGTPTDALPSPDEVPAWDATSVWPGGFITSVDVRRTAEQPGRARFWVRPGPPLLDEPVSPLARYAGILDIANGMAVREDPRRVAFPNVDLTAHLVREPVGDWVGFDTSVSFGPDGRGVTSSVLHDVDGPLGTLAQSLTVRPVPPAAD